MGNVVSISVRECLDACKCQYSGDGALCWPLEGLTGFVSVTVVMSYDVYEIMDLYLQLRELILQGLDLEE